ncbi:hypothetical protein UFOVP997_40 [uncultured Caudovirales phage]|uniref:Uncharacterized protein n=1 Tax=uncultured Caudovirales phage TaxID=2100421 RepID=A0A6J5QJW4_9CAUD|nr:hypothetical protein UFOVP486_31 [uncultured Caudovirales phage]CAB4170248.1 hypothetical protein UFOVP911_12 [uncultured Caudovirales phage]CAB4177380.1 hypothetical protein UFOVP997_40 [uncultured Caudovirales phage]CAB4182756.1 hypothetical protein UFOVP1088_20 [uncultured Caudovirales phage]CAB4186444.1 hypothetical protein UFOVP1149_43 [uncultured Caudovirales phage]
MANLFQSLKTAIAAQPPTQTGPLQYTSGGGLFNGIRKALNADPNFVKAYAANQAAIESKASTGSSAYATETQNILNRDSKDSEMQSQNMRNQEYKKNIRARNNTSMNSNQTAMDKINIGIQTGS